MKKTLTTIISLILLLSIGIVWAMHHPETVGGKESAFTVMTYNVGDIGRKTFPVKETADVILGGDFNTFPGSRAIRVMDRHFQDALWPGLDYLTGTYFKIDFPLRPRYRLYFSFGGVIHRF